MPIESRAENITMKGQPDRVLPLEKEAGGAPRNRRGAVKRFWNCFRRDEQAAVVLSSVVLLVCAAHEYSWRRQQPPMPPFFVAAPVQAPAIGHFPASTSTRQITIDVAGAVRRPGVQQWPFGARVFEAVQKAGGALPEGDAQALNLAARLQDGQQIRVSIRGATQRNAAPDRVLSKVGASRGMTTDARKNPKQFAGIVDVNTANAQDLDVLPGIGPATAARIVESRVRQGRFRSLEDLDRVKGLGLKKLNALRRHVAF